MRADSALLATSARSATADEPEFDLKAQHPVEPPPPPRQTTGLVSPRFFSFNDLCCPSAHPVQQPQQTPEDAIARDAKLTKTAEDARAAALKAKEAADMLTEGMRETQLFLNRLKYAGHDQTDTSQGGFAAGRRRARRARCRPFEQAEQDGELIGAGVNGRNEISDKLDLNGLRVRVQKIGNEAEFHQLDKDGDGNITKQEMLDRFFPFDS